MWEDRSNDAENTALITAINYILQYIHIEPAVVQSKTVFWIKSMQAWWEDASLKKTLKILLFKNIWLVGYIHYRNVVL